MIVFQSNPSQALQIILAQNQYIFAEYIFLADFKNIQKICHKSDNIGFKKGKGTKIKLVFYLKSKILNSKNLENNN